MRIKIALIVLPLLLAGCQTVGFGKKVTPQLASTGPAAASSNAISGGGLVGGPFGAALGQPDRLAAFEAEYKALEYSKGGELVTWAGKTGAAGGKVVAAQPYRVGSQDCRQYIHELTLSGATSSARGTACRNNDGTWSLLE
jgi:surface antigen